jgi:protein subunit release factor A
MNNRKLLKSWTKKNFRVDTFRAGGKGGQHQNKKDTGVRITDLETGLAAECREHKSQEQNKKKAFEKLVALLTHHYKEEWSDRPDISRSDERIRTYHEVRGEVKDHRTGEVFSYSDIVHGNGFGDLVESTVKQIMVTKDEQAE